MRNKRTEFYVAAISIAILTGCAGGSAFADSEASFQAGSQAAVGGSSENGHVGESQSNRESISGSAGGTQSSSSAHHENSTQATEETGRIPVVQPAVNGAPRNQGPATSGGAKQAGNQTPTSAGARSGNAPVKAHVPSMKTTTYHWRNSNSHTRSASKRRVSRSYMMNTIHQAASTK